MIKQWLYELTGTRAFSMLVSLYHRVAGDRRDHLAILTYHRVNAMDAKPELDPGLISASPEAFEQQMVFLKTAYNIISIEELMAVYQTGEPLPPRSVMITFDDAYRDFSDCAWPVLKRHHIPVALFVPTAFPGHPDRMFWWDRLYRAMSLAKEQHSFSTPVGTFAIETTGQRSNAYRRLKRYVKTLPHHTAMAWIDQLCDCLGAPPPEPSVLSWEALRSLAAEGVTLGAHTMNHPLMHQIPLEEAMHEATGSLKDLEREIGGIPPILAYPGGGVTESIRAGLRREGFALAFTTRRRGNDLRHPEWLNLSRINVGRRTTLPLLELQLGKYRVDQGDIAH